MHSPQRLDTTVPQQALFFINSPFVAERARAIVARNDIRQCETAAKRIERLYQLLYQRPPTQQQIELGLKFLADCESETPFVPPPPPPPVWQYGWGRFDHASSCT